MDSEVIDGIGSNGSNGTGLVAKYGLIVAIAMVVGNVVGSGIFFRTGRVIENSGGEVFVGVLAWLIGGAFMIVCAYTFSILARKIQAVGGFTSYCEAMLGKKFGYFVAWFMGVVYAPATTIYVAWIAARFTATLFNVGVIEDVIVDTTTRQTFIFAMAGFYCALIYALTVLAPKIAGYFAVSTVTVKSIPLILLGIVGIFVGIAGGVDIGDVSNAVTYDAPNIAIAIGSVAFAYAGWEGVAALNKEIKNSERNLPLALLIGGCIATGLYVLYFIGVATAGQKLNWDNEHTQEYTNIVANKIFGGPAIASILLVFIIMSCLGTVNGHTMAQNRYLYSASVRGMGPKPAMFAQIDQHNNSPVNAAMLSHALSMSVWFAVLMFTDNGWGVFKDTGFDQGDLGVFGFYVICVPLFIAFIAKSKDWNLHWINRFVFPTLSLLVSLFLVIAVAGLVDFRDGTFDFKLFGFYIFMMVVALAIGALFLIFKSKDAQAMEDNYYSQNQ